MKIVVIVEVMNEGSGVMEGVDGDDVWVLR